VEGGLFHFEAAADVEGFILEIDAGQQFAHCFGSHHGDEVVAHFIADFIVFIHFDELKLLIGAVTRVDHDKGFVIQHPFQVFDRHVQQGADLAGSALHKPDVGDRNRQLDVAHAGTTHPGGGYQHVTAIADGVLEAFLFILAAGALVIPLGAKDAFAKEAVLLGLEGAVVQGIGFGDFAMRPGIDDRVRRGDPDAHKVIVVGPDLASVVFQHVTSPEYLLIL